MHTTLLITSKAPSYCFLGMETTRRSAARSCTGYIAIAATHMCSFALCQCLCNLKIAQDLLTIFHANAVKSLLLHIYLAHRDWLPSGSVSSMHQASVEQLLFSFVGKVLHKNSTICLCLWPVNLTSTCLPLPPFVPTMKHQLHAAVLIFGDISADNMRAYFLPPRFYTKHYPYTGVRPKMVSLATLICPGSTRLHCCQY